MTTREEDESAEVEGVAMAGAELAGALAGGAVGTIGGPAGVFAGAAVGVFVQRGARAVIGRFHARERVRVGATLDLIAFDARERGHRGEFPRDDGFFEDRGELRPDGEELLEAVLAQAANAWEERKVALLARLYDGIAHDPTVSPAEAHFLVRAAGELTYRQFVILSVFYNSSSHQGDLIVAEGHREAGMTAADESLLAELDDLWDRRLLGVSIDGVIRSAGEVIASAMLARSAPLSNLRTTGIGTHLVALTGASTISADERRQIVTDLDRPLSP